MKTWIAAAAALAILVMSGAWAHDDAKKAKPAADKAAAAPQKKDEKAKPAAKQGEHDRDHGKKGH